MAEVKITNAKALELAIAILDEVEFSKVVEDSTFTKNEITEKLFKMLTTATKKRATKSGGITKATKANLGTLKTVVDEIGEFSGMTAKKFADAVNEVCGEEITTGKATAILKAGEKFGFVEGKAGEKSKDPKQYSIVEAIVIPE